MNITLKVAAVIFDSKNKILLIKEKYREAEGYKWNLIKGTFDKPKETLEECVRREIREEVRLEAGQVELKKIFHYGAANNTRMLFIFFVHNCTGQAKIPDTHTTIAGEKIQGCKWFERAEILAMPRDSFMAPYVLLSLTDANESAGHVDIKRL